MLKESFNNNENKKEILLSTKRKKLVDEIINLGIATNNHINFENFGEDFDKLQEIKINPKVKEGQSEESIKDIQNFIKIFKSYISKPIFTDEFYENHSNKEDPNALTRRKWEEDNLSKLSKEGQDYYNSNSISMSEMNGIIGYLDILEDSTINLSIRKEIAKLIDNLPQELMERKDKLSEDKKIEIFKEVKETLKKVIKLLEE